MSHQMPTRQMASRPVPPFWTGARRGVLWTLQRSERIYESLMFKLAAKAFFRPRPDDVYLVAYPKSGTTLLQMMLYQLTTDGEMDFPHIEAVSPWDKALFAGEAATIEALPSPRLLKSHAFYDQLPRPGRCVYMVRNVMDVGLSAYHHQCLFTGLELDREVFLDEFLAGRTPFGSWFRHLASWWPHRRDPNVLFLRYEEVIADLAGAVCRVADFCHLELDGARLARTVERCRVDFMRRYNDRFDPRLRQTSRTPREPGAVLDHVDRAGEGWSARHQSLLREKLAVLRSRLGAAADDPDGRSLFAGGEAAPAPPVPPSGAKPPLGMRLLIASLGLSGAVHQRLIAAHNALARKIARDHLAPPRPDDVYLAAYPGSGHPVLQAMLYQVRSGGDLDDVAHLEVAVPWYDALVYAGDAVHFAELPAPRLFLTHLRRDELPAEGRFIYLVRNPRDAALAFYHRHCLVYGVDPDPAAFVEQHLLRPHYLFGSWFDHTASWWPRRRDAGVLFLIYDEVLADLAGAVRQVADFCGMHLDEARVEEVAARCAPSCLRRHSAKLDPRLRQVSPGPAGSFIRAGRAGQGGAAFSDRQRALLTKRLWALGRELGPRDRDLAAQVLRLEGSR